jgi:hypothetical protein
MKRYFLSGLIILTFVLGFGAFGLSQDMPHELLNKIKEKYAKKYPDDYSMQKVLINDQIECYRFLQNYEPSGVPYDIFNRIKSKIESRYPYDFSMQKVLIEDQVECYNFLQNYNPPDVPYDVLEKIKRRIESRYPDDGCKMEKGF